jgi:hypothetical protein
MTMKAKYSTSAAFRLPRGKVLHVARCDVCDPVANVFVFSQDMRPLVIEYLFDRGGVGPANEWGAGR